MAETTEQNRSEAPTDYKLRKARDRGTVARSMDLGFLGVLLAFAGFALVAGEGMMAGLVEAMRIALSGGFVHATEPAGATGLLAMLYRRMIAPLVLLGGTLLAIVMLLEIVQLRGFIFTAHPLKPDWSRLNPAKGLKRLFTVRMLKETLKSIAKFALYATATWAVIRSTIRSQHDAMSDGERLAVTLGAAGFQLIFAFILIAVVIAIVDQLLVRGEFTKQMRMSRREVTRESREREGEPRIKQRRKQLHRDLAAASRGNLAGSDMLIVNPEHYAVALRYDDTQMAAPEVAIKGRNAHALRLREEAARRDIPVIAQPLLARALFRACPIGAPIPSDRYEAVAALYSGLRTATANGPA